MVRESVPRIQSSCPDLIRASIMLHESLAKKMDGRVKPGHDRRWRLRRPTDLPVGQNFQISKFPV
jgi:hypothetical protein